MSESAEFSFDELIKRVYTVDGEARADYEGLALYSHFQPILSLVHQHPIGYEALLRAKDANGQPVSPLEVFRKPRNEAELVGLDRLSRILHVANFVRQPAGNAWLFLNLNPEVAVHGARYGRFFSEMLAHFNFPAERVVIEILESMMKDPDALTTSVDYYRERGSLIAIDDFGAGHSNFDRIWRLGPDIVKLDRTMIVQAANDHRVRHIMPSMVALLHEAGSLVLTEGVETDHEAEITMDADVDFVQGYLFGRPAAAVEPGINLSAMFDGLWSCFRDQSQTDMAQQRVELEPYSIALRQAAQGAQTSRLWQTSPPLSEVFQHLLQLPRVERVYVLDGNGRQIGMSVPGKSCRTWRDARYAPLQDSAGAIWARRHYFRRAMGNPGEIQVTRPYLSLTGAAICITLSVAVFNGDLPVVLCGDLDWPELGRNT